MSEEKFDPVDKTVLEYKEPTTVLERQEGQLEEMWGILPLSRFKNVGRVFVVKATEDADTLATGDSQSTIPIPSELDGARLISAHATVYTQSSSGAITVQIRNITQSLDMLSTAITIDANEKTSYTAANPHIVNRVNGIVSTGDQLAVDIDGAGTGATGLSVILTFQ